jgi:hypothetical protein
MQDVGLVMFKPANADATPEEYGQLGDAQGQDTVMSEQVCGMRVGCRQSRLFLQLLVMADCFGSESKLLTW